MWVKLGTVLVRDEGPLSRSLELPRAIADGGEPGPVAGTTEKLLGARIFSLDKAVDECDAILEYPDNASANCPFCESYKQNTSSAWNCVCNVRTFQKRTMTDLDFREVPQSGS